MSERLASGPQLWAANRAGRLEIVEDPVTPIDFVTAWELVSVLAAGETQASEAVVLEENA